MVKATSLDMSLSEIISSNKKTKKGIRRPTGAGIKKRPSIGKGSAKGTPRRQSGGIRKPARPQATVLTPNEKRSVRINVSNLAPTVVSNDLRELFGEFKLHSVSVNFNEKGAPLGTGDLSLSKINADRLIQKFAGVALDGKVMQFAVIETSNVAARTNFTAKAAPKAQNRRNSAGTGRKVTKSPKAAAAKPAKKAGLKKKATREAKPKKTAEELDAELDAYMSRGN